MKTPLPHPAAKLTLKKQLISADDVRMAAKRGERVVFFRDAHTIVTAQAASTAKDLGITLQLGEAAASTAAVDAVYDAHQVQLVRQVVAAHMGGHTEGHAGGKAREELVAEVLRRIALERKQTPQQGVRKIAQLPAPAKVNGDGVLSSRLDLTTLLTNAPPPCAAGFMTWSRSFAPFTHDGDEVQVVLEGELHVRCGTQIHTARAGEVVLIPQGLACEIGSSASVRLFYLSYAAHGGKGSNPCT